MGLFQKHQALERHSLLLTVGILVVVAIGGIVEIAPLFYLENTIEKVQGMRPYTPLELAGRNVYIREGCYTCHSQMIRPLRDEVERYGPYSLAAESMYDHPFQWGSKRTGPDLARVGGKYSNEWHLDHMTNPRSVVPESIMPPYAFLSDNTLHIENIADHLKTLRFEGVPYTDDMIENAKTDLIAQVDPNADYDSQDALVARYEEASGRKGTVTIGDFDGDRTRITEMDAVIAYLQMTGTLVDFSTYEADDLSNRR
ncbi:MAG: cytochrome-c oxidase, cbb3-type subunit II [Alphaproteobacteria bacterium]|nr:cytochrome-c oxidase, cbb3-type subunit II [Alphaproteobacteria bacterium]MBU2083106.1 cytochrome-c oxidase, cbb3-type subunit II [Alphaproteobacteria bacterium]MBU2144595.1 cytochrome-c oxidase, cbb3-type subunit II [Alphaproteobacteria bacterium]MBU2195390.1 cytochrome-c oxidase, cbb3-type subunit II [Alphaproteobacteria bacterium]